MSPESAEKKTTVFLKRVSDFFAEHTNQDGDNICFKHHIEHVGKTVYSVLIDLHLYQETGDSSYLEKARSRALHISTKQKECFGDQIFGVSGADRWNMSNGMIDSGAACDSLATLLQHQAASLSEEEQAQIWQAVEDVCDSYLLDRVVIKSHTNQRLWGATGLASAYALKPKEVWKEAVQRSVAVSLAEIRQDGSIPYVTNYTKNGYPVGIKDTTTYYHSRHIAYAWHSLEQIGELTEEVIDKMRPAVDFLAGMYQENGVKNIQLETKRWYFNSEYEVGSHAYDVYVFAKFYAHTKDPRYAHYGKKAYQALCEHQIRNDGGIRDHKGGVENFQCPYFWNSHCAWLTRVDDELNDMLQVPDSPLENTAYLDTADIIQVVKNGYSCILRGRKQPCTLQWGPRVGGGSILYFGRRSENFKDANQSARDSDLQVGNFLWQQKNPSLVTVLKTNKRAIRSLIFYVVVELRAKDIRSALYRLVTMLRTAWCFDTRFSSAYFTNVSTTFLEDSVSFESGLSKMDGEELPGVNINRTYYFNSEGVQVREEFRSNKPLANLHYILHPHASDIEVESNGGHKVSDQKISFTRPVTAATISYQLK